jgi:peptidoglycan/LPS O-acetylase OafA/YrhL
MKAGTRLTELDLLRFIAAFSVMFFHFTTRGNADAKLIPVKFPLISEISRYGYLGVDLFFLISGFVILMTAVDRSAKSFLVSRMVRLYPAYWACCTLTFFITFFLGTDAVRVSFAKYLANMTMLHGFFNVEHVDGVYWSLFIEMKFYLLVLLLMIAKQIRYAQYYLGLWLLISLVWLHYPSSIIENVFIPEHSAYFISGAVFYLIWKEGISPYKLVLLLGGYVLAIANAIQMLVHVMDWYHIQCNVYIMIAMVTLFYVVFFLMVFNKFAFVRTDHFIVLGALTYPLYLLHSRIGFVMFNLGHTYVDKHVLLAVIVAAMCYLAYVVNNQIEKKFSPVFKKFLDVRISSTL